MGGAGKNLLTRTITRCLGEQNCSAVGQQELNSAFNGWLEHKLFIAADEIFMKSEDPGNMLYRINPFISEPKVNINDKGDKLRVRRNVSNWFVLSEEDRPIIARNSELRRWWMFRPNQKLDPELGARLHDDISEGGPGIRAFAYFCVNMPARMEVKPFERREGTAKQQLKNATMTVQKKFVEDIRTLGLDAIAEHFRREEKRKDPSGFPAEPLSTTPKDGKRWVGYPYPLMDIYRAWAKTSGHSSKATSSTIYDALREAFALSRENANDKPIKFDRRVVNAFLVGDAGLPHTVTVPEAVEHAGAGIGGREWPPVAAVAPPDVYTRVLPIGHRDNI
jgi:hypothetical protein